MNLKTEQGTKPEVMASACLFPVLFESAEIPLINYRLTGS